jgi:hypothetical protein
MQAQFQGEFPFGAANHWIVNTFCRNRVFAGDVALPLSNY